MFDQELGVRVRIACAVARVGGHDDVGGRVKSWVGAQTGGHVEEEAAEIADQLDADVDGWSEEGEE